MSADDAPAAAAAPPPAVAGPPTSETEAKPKKTPAKTPKKAAAAVPAAAPAAGEGDGTGGRARRERKPATEVYVVEAKKEEEFVVQQGPGQKLRDIPNVAFKMGKLTGRDELLEQLHSLMYRRKGAVSEPASRPPGLPKQWGLSW